VEAAHAAAGARWVSDDVHWPIGYGADEGVPASGAGLAEIGPFDELLLRGPGAAAAAAGLAGPAGGGEDRPRVVPVDLRGTRGEAWFLGPDEVLLLGPIGDWLATLARDLASGDVSAIEMTGARTTIRLAGAMAPDILAELCAADTHPRTMGEGSLTQAPMVGVRAFIARQDAAAGTGYTIMVSRDEAAYIWDAIGQIGAAHGLRVVGPAAVAPARGAGGDA
jgi:sarcosine oxidase subunit gamma